MLCMSILIIWHWVSKRVFIIANTHTADSRLLCWAHCLELKVCLSVCVIFDSRHVPRALRKLQLEIRNKYGRKIPIKLCLYGHKDIRGHGFALSSSVELEKKQFWSRWKGWRWETKEGQERWGQTGLRASEKDESEMAGAGDEEL